MEPQRASPAKGRRGLEWEEGGESASVTAIAIAAAAFIFKWVLFLVWTPRCCAVAGHVRCHMPVFFWGKMAELDAQRLIMSVTWV